MACPLYKCLRNDNLLVVWRHIRFCTQSLVAVVFISASTFRIYKRLHYETSCSYLNSCPLLYMIIIITATYTIISYYHRSFINRHLVTHLKKTVLHDFKVQIIMLYILLFPYKYVFCIHVTKNNTCFTAATKKIHLAIASVFLYWLLQWG